MEKTKELFFGHRPNLKSPYFTLSLERNKLTCGLIL